MSSGWWVAALVGLLVILPGIVLLGAATAGPLAPTSPVSANLSEASSHLVTVPAFDRGTSTYCGGNPCTKANWFGSGSGTGGALMITPGANDEFLLLEISTYSAAGTLTAADVSGTHDSGWTLLSNNDYFPSTSPWWNQTVLYTEYTGAGVADTITIDTAGPNWAVDYASAIVAALSGVDLASPLIGSPSFNSGNSVSPSASLHVSLAPTTVVGLLSVLGPVSGVTAGSGFHTIASVADASGKEVTYAEESNETTSGTFTSAPTLLSQTYWGEIAIAVQGTPLAAPTVSPAGTYAMDLGQGITFGASWSGGNPDYTAALESSASATCSSPTTVQSIGSITGTSTTFTEFDPAQGALYYCVQVTDAYSQVTISAATEVVVNPALVANPIIPSAPSIDVGQTIGLEWDPSGGTGPTYTPQWYASSADTGSCTSGTIQPTGGSFLYADPSSSTYYCYAVTDGSDAGAVTATSPFDLVTVNTALVAGPITPIAPSIDDGQTIGLEWNPSGGTGPDYTPEWYGASTGTGTCTSGTNYPTGGTFLYVAPSSSTYYCYTVTDDSDAGGVTATSSYNLVTVNPALGTATISSTTSPIVLGQTESVVANIASVVGTGTGILAYSLLSSGTSAGTYTASGATCTPSGTTLSCSYVPSIAGTYYYKLTVTDQAYSPETTTSAASGAVDVTSGTLSISPSTGPMGTTVTLSGSSFADSRLYNYCFEASGTPTACSTAHQFTATVVGGIPSGVTIVVPASNNAQVVVSDASSSVVTATAAFTIIPGVPLTAPTVTPSGTYTMDLGQDIAFSASWTGGNPDYTVVLESSVSSNCSSPTMVLSQVVAGTSATFLAFAPAGGTLYYCVQVTDSYSQVAISISTEVVVNTALTAGRITPNAPTIDDGQSIELSSHAAGGTAPRTVVWYSSATGTSACSAGTLQTPEGTSFLASPSTSTYYCYTVTDSSDAGAVTVSSAFDLVTVSATLVAGPISPSAPSIDAGQTIGLSSDVSGGTGPFTIVWYSSATDTGACTSGASQTPSGTTFAASPSTSTYYCYTVSDSSGAGAVTVPSAFDLVTVNAALAAGAITPGAPAIDAGQSIELTSAATGGTDPLAVVWYSSTTDTNACSSGTPLMPEGTSFSASPSATTYYCYTVTDSSDAGAVTLASGFDLVTVNAALVGGAITPSAPAIDDGQTIELTSAAAGGTAPLTVTWYSAVTDTGACTSGTVLSPEGITLSVSPTSSRYYCYAVADSSSAGAVTVSSAFDLVTVNAALAAGTILPAAPAIDAGQSIELTSAASGGTGPLTIVWYSSATDTATCSSGTALSPDGASYSAGPTTSTYYCYAVTDSSSAGAVTVASPFGLVTVNAAMAAGAISPGAPAIDLGQSIELTSAATGGTGPFTVIWYASANDTGACSSGAALSPAGTGISVSPSSGTYYCYTVTDSSAAGAVTVASTFNHVTVNPALVAGPITPSAPTIDYGQSVVLSAPMTLPGGTPPLSFDWYWSASDSGSCGGPGSAILGGLSNQSTGNEITGAGTYYYCYVVTDSAYGPSSVASAWEPVTVNPALGTATISATVSPIPVGETEIVTASIASVVGTGTGTLAYSLLSSRGLGGTYTATGATCTSSGTTLSCSDVPSNAGTYYYKVTVTDQAHAPETTTSAASGAVDVTSGTLLLSPSTGPMGTTVTLGGSGFEGSTLYNFCFEASGTPSACGTTNQLTTTASGTIPGGVTIAVPARNNAQVVVSDATSNVVAATAVFSATPGAVYTVTFTETGLSSGTPWSLTINGETLSSSSPTIVVQLANGTFPYTLHATGSFYPWTSATGSTSVNGAAKSVAVTYAYTYLVSFVESGLSGGTSWTVVLSSTGGAVPTWTNVSTGGAMEFRVANGTYSWAATAVGYTTATGSFSVSGPVAAQPVAFSAPSSSSTPSWVWVVLAVIVVLIVIGAVWMMMRRRGKNEPPSSNVKNTPASKADPATAPGSTPDGEPKFNELMDLLVGLENQITQHQTTGPDMGGSISGNLSGASTRSSPVPPDPAVPTATAAPAVSTSPVAASGSDPFATAAVAPAPPSLVTGGLALSGDDVEELGPEGMALLFALDRA